MKDREKQREYNRRYYREHKERYDSSGGYHRNSYTLRKKDEAAHPEKREARLKRRRITSRAHYFLNKMLREKEEILTRNMYGQIDSKEYLLDELKDQFSENVKAQRERKSFRLKLLENEIVQEWYNDYNEVLTFEQIVEKKKTMRKYHPNFLGQHLQDLTDGRAYEF